MDKDYGRGCCEKTLEWLTIDESCFISFGGVLLLLLILRDAASISRCEYGNQRQNVAE